MKKLSLNKETLRSLDEQNLSDVRGGDIYPNTNPRSTCTMCLDSLRCTID